MAALYEKPLKENEEGEAMYNYDDDSAFGSGCGYFRLLGFRPQRKRNDNESKYLLQQKGDNLGNHGNRSINWAQVKDFCEKVRINKNKKDRNKFQYDLESYALNFDDGFDFREDDLVLGFLSRFAAPIHNHEE
ncbi:hypothetical protein CFP56_018909 [Quercus suber]|uniref:Uncharacterized protein n=1 Tax=Quercus suber TaxID=58331 RepID=A0AAW0KK36_QUESU